MEDQKYKQVLLGSLFGDGSLQKNKSNSKQLKSSKGIGIRFKERHSLKQSEYLLWKKQILSQQFNIKTYSDNNSITIYSNISPLFKEYYNNFYPLRKGYKIFSLEMLNKLKPLGLAIWYMDDGHFNKRSYNFDISCDNKNIHILQGWFKKKYDMEGKIYSGIRYAKINFNKKDTRKFFRIIHSFIHLSMKYKIKRTKEEINIARGYARNYQRRKAKSDKQKS